MKEELFEISISIRTNNQSISTDKETVVQPKENNSSLQLPKLTNKIQSELTVAQLAYFAKLTSQAGIVKPKSHMNVFQYLGENFATPNQTDISPESVRSKFYGADISTKEAIRQRLHKMIEFIDEDIEEMK